MGIVAPMLNQLRTSVSRLKPEWLSWGAIWWLVIQCILASLVIYAVVGNLFGYLTPSTDLTPPSDVTQLVAFIIASLALVAALGIYLNWWWAYFLEFALLWTLAYLIFFNPVSKTPPENVSNLEITGLQVLDRAIWVIGMLVLSCNLLGRGFTGFKERRSSSPPVKRERTFFDP